MVISVKRGTPMHTPIHCNFYNGTKTGPLVRMTPQIELTVARVAVSCWGAFSMEGADGVLVVEPRKLTRLFPKISSLCLRHGTTYRSPMHVLYGSRYGADVRAHLVHAQTSWETAIFCLLKYYTLKKNLVLLSLRTMVSSLRILLSCYKSFLEEAKIRIADLYLGLPWTLMWVYGLGSL